MRRLITQNKNRKSNNVVGTRRTYAPHAEIIYVREIGHPCAYNKSSGKYLPVVDGFCSSVSARRKKKYIYIYILGECEEVLVRGCSLQLEWYVDLGDFRNI